MIKTSQKGFTLIEVLIAVFILVLVMGAAIMVENQGLKSGSVNQSRLYANGLAQEGLEMTKWIRDENLRNNRDPINGSGPNSGTSLKSGEYCWNEETKLLTKMPAAPQCTLDNDNSCPCKVTGPDGKVYLRVIDIP